MTKSIRTSSFATHARGRLGETVPAHDETLTRFDATVRRNYRDWILKKNAGQPLNQTQTAFLELIRDHITTSPASSATTSTSPTSTPKAASAKCTNSSAMAWSHSSPT